MRIILMPLFEILTGDVAVCDNVLMNYVIMLVIGEIAFRVARSLIGYAYHSDMIDGKAVGSILHWLLRLFVYILIAYVLRTVIAIYYFVVGIPAWVLWSALAITITGIAVLVIWSIVKSKSCPLDFT